jgi:uncharacterized protein YndB with AHSA1/START domain
MSKRQTVHDTFTIERTFAATPARVFAAFADPEAKKRWFGGPPGWEATRWDMDFRIGGHDHSVGRPPGGPVISMESTYHDIVPAERIVYTYVMHVDDAIMSVSLASVEFRPEGQGTHMVLTEHGAYFDAHAGGAKDRQQGTRWLMDKLAASLGEGDSK